MESSSTSRDKINRRQRLLLTKKDKKSPLSTTTSKNNNNDATAKSNGLMSKVHYLLGHDKPLLSKQGAEALILWSYSKR